MLGEGHILLVQEVSIRLVIRIDKFKCTSEQLDVVIDGAGELVFFEEFFGFTDKFLNDF